MIKLEKMEVFGWKHAIRGMRNPMNSWDKSDTDWIEVDWFSENDNIHDILDIDDDYAYVIGDNDLDLMKRLRKAGTDHRKYLRMITVYVDITAPLYWFKEFDTYKVGTVANSCSTMHKIHAKEFTLDDFSCEYLMDKGVYTYPYGGVWRGLSPKDTLKAIIGLLNNARNAYLNLTAKLKRKDLTDAERKHTKSQQKYFWWQMIQLLPSSYNQKRTVMLNYEVLNNMYHSRKNHKLDEWREFCKWIETLPYAKELIYGK